MRSALSVFESFLRRFCSIFVHKAFHSSWALLLGLLALTGGAPKGETTGLELAPLERLILIGDAGALKHSVERAVVQEAAKYPEKTTLIFLGDNLYPRGVLAETSPKYAKTTARFRRYLESFKATKARVVFIPGNHDWDDSKQDGQAAVRRQERLVESVLGKNSFYPKGACPGPAEVSRSAQFHIVAFDTQWWLHPFEKPGLYSDCPGLMSDARAKMLQDLFKETPSTALRIILSHHPLESGGSHSRGSYCFQNAHCPAYKEMSAELHSLLSQHKPFLCAAGHDHSLQLLGGKPFSAQAYSGVDSCALFMVSGAASRLTDVEQKPNTLFAAREFGFFIVDSFASNKIRIRALMAPKDEETRILFEQDFTLLSKTSPPNQAGKASGS